MADTLRKQPAESRLFDMDFSPRIASAESLIGTPAVSEKTVDQETGEKTVSTDLTIGTATISGQVAQARISGGLDEVLYEVTFLASTDLGNTVEAEGLLLVQDTV
jgi:hypothetical protein